MAMVFGEHLDPIELVDAGLGFCRASGLISVA